MSEIVPRFRSSLLARLPGLRLLAPEVWPRMSFGRGRLGWTLLLVLERSDMRAIYSHECGGAEGECVMRWEEEKSFVRGQVCDGCREAAGGVQPCLLVTANRDLNGATGLGSDQQNPEASDAAGVSRWTIGGSNDGELSLPFHGASRHANPSCCSVPGAVSVFRLVGPCKPIDRLFRLDILARYAAHPLSREPHIHSLPLLFSDLTSRRRWILYYPLHHLRFCPLVVHSLRQHRTYTLHSLSLRVRAGFSPSRHSLPPWS